MGDITISGCYANI